MDSEEASDVVHWLSSASIDDRRDGRTLATLDVQRAKRAIDGKEFNPIARSQDLRGKAMRFARFNDIGLIDVSVAGSDLRDSQWSDVWITHCNFTGTQLQDAHLHGVKLLGARMSTADFSRAGVHEVVATDSVFKGADFHRSEILETTFDDCDFTDADLSEAHILNTTFRNCPTLGKAKGLDNITIVNAVTLDLPTLRSVVVDAPDSFLLDVGYTPFEISQLRALYDSGIQFHSCFISHAEADLDFAGRLREQLQLSGVSCWHYRENLKIGDLWETQIERSIKVHEKLLLVCSERSVFRPNVVKEIIHAIDLGRETGKQKLFPVRLDDYILTQEARDLGDDRVAAGEWPSNWIRHLQKIHIGDFRDWQFQHGFQSAFEKLLKDLKTS